MDACQQNACNGGAYRPQKGSPVIQKVSLSQPLPENPWQITLNMDFLDTGGDLGSGLAFVYLQGSPQVARSFSLDTYFRASELPLDATGGTVALYMMLPPDAFPDATTVQMDLQVEDASAPDPGGLFSNCYRMNLDFDVVPLASQTKAALVRASERASGAWGRAACWLYGCSQAPTP